MEKEEQELPSRLWLEDGTEVRLVPLERTKGKALYVSKDGRGFSYTDRWGRTRVKRRLREVKPHANGSLCSSRTRLKFIYFSVLVHVAVLLAWGFPQPEGYECDHKNGDHFDNRLENLEWVTREENAHRRWILNTKKGLGYSGKKLTELGKRNLRRRRQYMREKKVLVQLELQFDI